MNGYGCADTDGESTAEWTRRAFPGAAGEVLKVMKEPGRSEEERKGAINGYLSESPCRAKKTNVNLDYL